MSTTVADPIARVAGRRVLIAVAHGDDAALFVGGTIRLLADAGCSIHLLRFTDDCTDSVGLDPASTVAANDTELAQACAILGIAERTDLGYPSDTLGDVRRGELREHAIRIVRQVRPYAVLTFDPYAAYGEDNQDHVRVAQEMDESVWTAMFDKHHPEHLANGLAPHGVVERWYFGRRVTDPTDIVDVSSVATIKAEAAVAHRTMMGNLMHQLTLMADTAGLDADQVQHLLADQDDLVRSTVQRSTTEAFRIVRFAGFADLFADLTSATPTPDPTPDPTADPTPDPTPDPSPDPTPKPAPKESR